MSRIAVAILIAGASALLIAGYNAFIRNVAIPGTILIQSNPEPRSDTVLARAKSDFADYCARCHGPAGKGDGVASALQKEKPPDLTDRARIGVRTDGELYWSVTRGVRPVMPDFQTKLDGPRRWGLVWLLRDISGTQPNTVPARKLR